MLLTYLRLGLSSGLFTSGLPTNNIYIYVPLLSNRSICLANLNLIDLIITIRIGEEYKL
jgi:hypothetical protein